MITGNKGEWSEPYALLKLISEGRLNLGKDNYEILEDVFYPIIGIIRHEKSKNIHFSYENDLVIVNNGNDPFRLPISTFFEYSKLCLSKIKTVTSKDGSFSIPEIENFLNSISLEGLKSKAKNKHDITIQFNDPKLLFSPTLGFSIKSQLGSPATLVNSSNATNFTFAINGNLSNSDIEKINATKKFSDKISLIENLGCSLSFEKVDSEVFKINLQTIDYNFPKILADILLDYCKNNVSKNNNIPFFVNQVTIKNEFGYNLNINCEIYRMMMKKFLVDYALGMRAAEVWKRDYQASGGYLIVRSDGEILCYHFYFTKLFEDYLFNNTKLETPDVKRYFAGQVYHEDGLQKIKLNLQIRFNK